MARKGKENKIKNKVVNYMNTWMKLSIGGSYIDITETIEDSFDVTVKAGQKRTVPFVGDKILKLVSSKDGLDDNINEILTSEEFVKLNKKGKISDEELEHFAIVEMVDDDPFIIEAPRYTIITDWSRFKDWYKEHKDDDCYRGETKNTMVSYFLLSQEDLNKQVFKIMNVMSKFTIGSDSTPWKVPENIVVDEDTGKLVFCDMGSVLPKYKGTDVSCRICQSDKVLLVAKVSYKSKDQQDNVMRMDTGLYGCKNEDCTDHYTKLALTKSSNNVKDSVVFDAYQTAVKSNQRFISDRANFAKIFFPQTSIDDFSEFKSELEEDTGEKFSASDLRIIWRNSVPYIISELVETAYEDIEERMEDEDEEFDDFDEFKDMVYEEVNSYEDDDDEYEDHDLIDIFAALQYIKYKMTEASEDSNMFTVLLAEDKSDFISILESINIDEKDDVNALWNILKSFISSSKK
ncbi:MAG: hypothetical protein ACRCX8_12720 [Sarcina sp.]